METTPAVDQAVDCFDAHTIIDIGSGEGSTVRFCDSVEGEFVKLRTDRVGKRLKPLAHEKLMGCFIRDPQNERRERA